MDCAYCTCKAGKGGFCNHVYVPSTLKGMSNKIFKRRIVTLLDISVLTNIIKVLLGQYV